MYINPINNINFQAKIAKAKVPILKRNGNKGYQNCSAKLWELDINNPNDMQKIREICRMPEFALYSYELPQALTENNTEEYKKHCFVLTKDNNKTASDIDKNDVLGMFTFYETNKNEQPNIIKFFITNLQYRTKWNCSVHEKEYMHIGNGMAKAAKSISPQKSLYCYSEPWAVKFWEKNGFKQISEQNMLFRR